VPRISNISSRTCPKGGLGEQECEVPAVAGGGVEQGLSQSHPLLLVYIDLTLTFHSYLPNAR